MFVPLSAWLLPARVKSTIMSCFRFQSSFAVSRQLELRAANDRIDRAELEKETAVSLERKRNDRLEAEVTKLRTAVEDLKVDRADDKDKADRAMVIKVHFPRGRPVCLCLPLWRCLCLAVSLFLPLSMSLPLWRCLCLCLCH